MIDLYDFANGFSPRLERYKRVKLIFYERWSRPNKRGEICIHDVFLQRFVGTGTHGGLDLSLDMVYMFD